MAMWKQPYRSGLRDVAEGLIRQAQLRQQQGQVEAQMQMMQGEIAARTMRELGQGLSNAFTQMQQQKLAEEERERQEASAFAGRVLDVAGEQLGEVRRTTAGLAALGAPEHEILASQELQSRLEGVMSAPLSEVPGLYESAMGTPVATRAPFEIPGFQPPGGTLGPEMPPGLRREEPLFGAQRDAREQFSRGMGLVESLRRNVGWHDALAENALTAASNADPSNPGSIQQFAGAIASLSALPPRDRDRVEAALQPYVDQVLSGEGAELFQNALTSGRLTVRGQEMGVQLQEQTYDMNIEASARAAAADARAEAQLLLAQNADARAEEFQPLRVTQLQGEIDRLDQQIDIAEENNERARAAELRAENADARAELASLQAAQLHPLALTEYKQRIEFAETQEARAAAHHELQTRVTELNIEMSEDQLRVLHATLDNRIALSGLSVKSATLGIDQLIQSMRHADQSQGWTARQQAHLAQVEERVREFVWSNEETEWLWSQQDREWLETNRGWAVVDRERGDVRWLWEADAQKWTEEQRDMVRAQHREWLRNAPIEYQAAVGRLNDASTARVYGATQTGVYDPAAFTNDEKNALAAAMGTNAQNLPAVMSERREQLRGDENLARMVAEVEYADLVARHQNNLKSMPVQLQRELAGLGEDAARAIGVASESGIYEHLSPRQKETLARVWDTTVEGLPEAANEVIANKRQREALDRQMLTAQAIAADQQVALNDRSIRLGDVRLDAETWRFERDQRMAPLEDDFRTWDMQHQRSEGERQAARAQHMEPLEDEHSVWRMGDERATADQAAINERVRMEQNLLSGVATATTAGDVQALSFYAAAMESGSPLGQALLEMGVTPEEMSAMMVVASELQDLEMRRVEADVSYRESVADEAVLSVQQAQALTPLQTKALNAQYELDERRARSDIANLAFDDQVNRVMALTQLADAVPSAYWENLPKALQSAMSDVGLSVDELQSRSEFAEWLRLEPERQRGADFLKFLTEAPPTDDAAFATMVSGVNEALNLMGVTDETARMAYLSAVQGIWNVDNREYRLRLAQLNMQAATASSVNGYDSAEAKRVLDAFSSVSNSLTNEMNLFALQVLSGSGCQSIRSGSRDEGWRLELRKPRDQAVTTVGGYDNCGQVFDQYDALRDSVREANEAQGVWARNTQGSVGGTVAGRAPPPRETPAPDGPPASNGSTQEFPPRAQPEGRTSIAPSGADMPTAFSGTDITPRDRAKLSAAVQALLDGDEEGYGVLYEELVNSGYRPVVIQDAITWLWNHASPADR